MGPPAARTAGLNDRVMRTLQSVLSQPVDILVRALLDPGDVVVVERPTSVVALQQFRLGDARWVSVPAGAQR